MLQQNTILTDVKGSVAAITLNRPDVCNAMNISMIRELTAFIKRVEATNEVRVVSINSSGRHFSGGADLNWLKEGLGQSPEQLRSESLELANLFRILWESHLIVLSGIHGKAIGGANGLVAVSDIVVAENSAYFSFSEAKLGLVPATIAPFLVRKLGVGRSTELMLSGRSFDAYEAKASGFVHNICDVGALGQTMEIVIASLLTNGPEAMKAIKHLLRWLESDPSSDQIQEYTAALIAERRIFSRGTRGNECLF